MHCNLRPPDVAPVLIRFSRITTPMPSLKSLNLSAAVLKHLTVRLHVMQPVHSMDRRKLSVRPSLCPSIRQSVKRVDCDKTKETGFHILTPHERIIHPSFLTRTMVDGNSLLPDIMGANDPAGAKTKIVNKYSPVEPQL